MTRTMSQRRAEQVLADIGTVPSGLAQEYCQHVKSMPSTIQAIGLGQAVATWMAKAGKREKATEKAHGLLVDHLGEWLCEKNDKSPYFSSPTQANWKPSRRLIAAICAKDQAAYAHATAEAIAYLDWLKKVANALLVEVAKSAEKKS